MPPRVRASELWRVAPEWLEQAQDDATLLAIRAQELAGLDIITDGEMRRESYSNRFATALDGVDLDNPGKIISRSGSETSVPRVVGKIRRKHPVEVRDLEFLRANTSRPIKITVPGPFTMSQQAQNDYYDTEEEMALDYAAAVNAEMKDLFAAGADIVQIDEPWMEAHPEKARRFGLAALRRALEGIGGTDRAPHLLWLCGAGSGTARRLFVSGGIGGLARSTDFDRDGPVRTGYQRAGEAAAEDDHSGRDRSIDASSGDAADCGCANQARVCLLLRQIGWCLRPIAE